MLTEMCNVLAECYRRGWITTRDGNASFRRGGSSNLYITPSGARKNVIRVEDIIKLTITQGGILVPDGSRPSGELHMHFMIQRDAKGTQSVLHVHPTYTVAAMQKGFQLSDLAQAFPELGRYTKVGDNVPVLPVTTVELGNATYGAIRGYDIVGQVGHGVCAVARDPWAAFEHVERLEHICQIVLASGVQPGPVVISGSGSSGQEC